MRFFSLFALAIAATSVEAASVHNQAHAVGASKMHGPHTKQQLAQLKGKRTAFHGPLEKPSLAQQKSKQKSKLKNKNKVKSKAHSKGKGQEEFLDHPVDWNAVGDRAIGAIDWAKDRMN